MKNVAVKRISRVPLMVACLALLAAALMLCAACTSSTSSASASASSSSSSEASSSSSSGVLSASEPSYSQEKPKSNAFYVMVVGNDTRSGAVGTEASLEPDGNTRSDTMMLVRVDPDTYLISIVTVPRDTEALIDGEKLKINEAYNRYGIAGTVDEVEKLTGTRARYSMETTFVGFGSLVDDLGSLFAHVPIDTTCGDEYQHRGSITIPAGDWWLDGAEALAFARMRKDYGDYMDARRQIQDRQLLQSAIQKVLDDPDNAQAYVDILYNNITTDWPYEEFSAVVADFAAHADKVRFVSGTGPHEGGIDEETELWLTPRDEATWRKVMKVVDAGGDPNTVVTVVPPEE